jgi:hypothetical protein
MKGERIRNDSREVQMNTSYELFRVGEKCRCLFTIHYSLFAIHYSELFLIIIPFLRGRDRKEIFCDPFGVGTK